MEDGVDVINLSWSFRRDPGGLAAAIETAVNAEHKALVFCAKSDDPYVNEAVPADYSNTISVAAATSRGRISTEGSKAPDLVILGEDMPAYGPDYAVGRQPTVATKVSGSSVATALASGMASLILMLARRDDELKGRWRLLKDRAVMLALFRRFRFDRSDGADPSMSDASSGRAVYVNPTMLFGLPKERLITQMRSVVYEAQNRRS
jgi:subtilisin family serine protease